MYHSLVFSFRILLRYRLYTFISIVGLALSFACCWFIFDYVSKVYSYDQFHDNSANIYRVSMEIDAGGSTNHYATTGKPLGVLIKNKYHGIANYSRLVFQKAAIKLNGSVFQEQNFCRSNPGIFEVFSFQIIDGSLKNIREEEKSLLLSESIADKYFPDVTAVGQYLGVGEESFLVGAVFKDWPRNSHLTLNALIIEPENEVAFDGQDWFDLDQYHYVALDRGKRKVNLDEQLQSLVSDEITPILEGSGIAVKFRSQSIEDLYFGEALIDDLRKGNSLYVKGLIWSGCLILLIGGLNHINLTLTRSSQRIKEIALKRILGLNRLAMIKQNILEAGLMAFFVTLGALLLIVLGENWYQSQSGYWLWGSIKSWAILLVIFALTLVLGLLGQSYSGIRFSLSGKVVQGGKRSVQALKYGILTLQLILSSVLLVGSFGFAKQIDFISTSDVGFKQSHIAIIGLPDGEDMSGAKKQLQEQLSTLSAVTTTSLVGGGALPGEENGKDLFEVSVDGNKEERIFNIYRIDEHYFPLLEIPLAVGRNFDQAKVLDVNESIVINQRLARELNWQNPIGQVLWYGEVPRKVIGVVEDFHNKSLHHLIEPIVFLYDENHASNLLVKSNQIDAESLGMIWSNFFPNSPFNLTYFDQFIASSYRQEQLMKQLINLFTGVALVLSFVGLFGIFSLQVFQRTKEISIRKVMGANFWKIWSTLTKTYFKIALMAMGLAAPFSWYALQRWLQTFSYKVQLGWHIFLWPSVVVLLICFITLCYHTALLANKNPAESLKEE